MKEKIEKENIIKTRSEKGAITLFVLLACLFFVFTLTGVYISSVNRLKSQEQNIKQIQENYKRELDNIDEIYEEISSDGVIVILTAEPEEWTKTVTLKGIGEAKEGKNIEIVECAFTKDKDVPLSTDWKSAEESEKTKIEKTDEVTENGKYIFWVKDKEGNIYKSNEINITNIDTTPPTAGSIIAKIEDEDGNEKEYEFNKWTDKDVYVEKVDGTDGESGHKSTTITVQKNGITMGEYTNVEGPITLTENGTYTITVTTEDNAGNKTTSEPYIVRIDKVVPELALKHNDASGADYEQGTWTKDNLYGEITIDTSNSGKTVEKYQYSYNGITWNDVSAETAPTSLDYTTTFPMGEDKPEWISGPTNNGTYYFEVQADGTLKPNNSGVNSVTANSYFEIDLTEYPDAELEITINATISSQSSYDVGYAIITTQEIMPEYNSNEEKIINVSGETKTANYTAIIAGGEKYYLYLGYQKDEAVSLKQDTFIINNISLRLEYSEKNINFYNYAKQDNRVSFTLQDNLEEEIYIRAVYNSEENDTSRYTEKQSIKIDKISPTIESAEPVVISKNDAKLNVKVTEDGSGLKGYYISTEGLAPTEQSTWTEQILKEFTIEGLKTETIYYLWTIDNVGNISEKNQITIGTANYLVDGKVSKETLEEAIEVAIDGSTIILLNDYTDTSTVNFNKNITFDIQSYVLTRNSTITINSEKIIEITGTGKITTQNSNVNTITNNGILSISNKVTIENMSTLSDYASIYNDIENAIVNIEDNVCIIGYYKGIYNKCGTINVNGGYIEATYNSSSAYGIYNYIGPAKVIVNAGEIRGYNGVYGYYNNVLIEINGGEIIGTGAVGARWAKINVYGGRVEGKTYGVYTGILTIGKEEEELNTTQPAIYGELYAIYMSDITYSFNFYNGVLISNTENTIYRGEIKLREKHMLYTYFDNNNELKYCTILVPIVENILMEAIPSDYTNKDVTVKVIYPYNTNETREYSVNRIDWISVDEFIKDDIIIDKNTIVYARTINEQGIIEDEAQIEVNNIDKENPIITITPLETEYIVNEQNETKDISITINVEDQGVSGLASSQCAWVKDGEEIKYIDFNNTITIEEVDLEIGRYRLYVNAWDNAGNRIDIEPIVYNIKYSDPVAQIQDKKFLTIQDAIETCSKNAGEIQTTIFMLRDTNEIFEVYEGQNIILDLKGYTVEDTMLNRNLCVNNGKLQIIDTSSEKTGKITSINESAIQNNGTFVFGVNDDNINIDSPTIFGKKNGITNNNVFEFYDGKIESLNPINKNVTKTPQEYGPVSTKYENGITTVQLGIVTEYEARIEWVYYTTVQEAVNATQSNINKNRDTVTIIKDIQLKNALRINTDDDMILNLNGYTLTIIEKSSVIENYGNLEIIDESNMNMGNILVDSAATTCRAIRNAGQLVLSGGNVTTINNNTGSGNQCYGIYNATNSKIIMRGGNIYSNSTNSSLYCCGIFNSSGGNILIENGTINVDSNNVYGIYNNTTGIVKILDGTINAVAQNTAYAIGNVGSGLIEICGGEINSNSDSMNYVIYNNSTATIKISGGTITGKGIYIYAISNNGTMEILDMNLISEGAFSYGIKNEGNMILKTGNIEVNGITNSSSNSCIGIKNDGALDFKDGKIIVDGKISNSTNYGISNSENGIINFNMVNIIINNGFSYGIYNNGFLTMVNGIIKSKGIYSYGAYNDENGILKLGNQKDDISLEKLKVISESISNDIVEIEEIGLYNVIGTVEFYNGILQGETPLLGYINQTREGYQLEKDIIENKNSIYLNKKEHLDYIVQVNDIKFHTLQEALQNIEENQTTTIKVLKNFELTESITFNKNIILDLNGFCITNENSSFINVGLLNIIDTTENKTGKIKSIETGTCILNKANGELTINDITMEINSESNIFSIGVYNINNGIVKISNSKIINSGSGQNRYGILNLDNARMELQDTVIDVNGYTGGYGINNQENGTIKMINGTIMTNYYGIYNDSKEDIDIQGEITVNGLNGDAIYGIYNNNIGIIRLNTININVTNNYYSDSYGVYNRTSGTVEILFGKINAQSKGDAYGIYNTYTRGTIIVGIKDDGLVSQENPKIKGESLNNSGYGVYNRLGIFNYYDGILEGTLKAVYNNNITEYETNTNLDFNNDETILKLSSEIKDAVQVGEMVFPTIEEAINSANKQTIIKLLRNITYTNNDMTLNILNDKDIILDLNGYTIYSSIAGEFLINNGKLQIIDTSQEKTGLIKSNSEYVINNALNGELMISDITLENNFGSLIYNEGNLTLKNSKISSYGKGIYNTESGHIIIMSGIIENQLYNNGGIVEIIDGYIGGEIYSIYNDKGILKILNGNIISNCEKSYYSPNYAIYNNLGEVYIGTKDNNPLDENLLIKSYRHTEISKSYGIYNLDGKLYYYDGKIQGTDKAIYGKIDEIEDLTELVVTTENEDSYTFETLTLEQKTTNAVAINGTEYDSLSKAIKSSGETQCTIKLLRDIGLGADAVIELNQNIIIDLNGYTLSNYNEITNSGTLKIIDTSSEQTGKIIGLTGIAISNTGTMELNSGTITNSTYGIKNTGTLNITGGKIENNTYGIYNDASGIVTMTNSDITTNKYGIYNYSSTATANINGGTISSNEYGVYNYNGTTNITSSGITNNTTYGIYNAGGTTNIKEGSQVQSQTGIYVANGTVNIGEQGTMNSDSPIIIGEEFGLEVSGAGTVYMYDGQIKGKQGATQGFITYTETGYAVANKVEGEYFVDYLALAGTISTVAEVNGVSFSNLQSAINSVVGEEPQTVKLTNGIISDITFNIAEGQNIILDMNGKTISSDLDVTMNNAGTLVIIDSASSGVAKISSTVGTAINNTGTLILGQDDGTVSQDAITIEGQTYGITTSGTLNFYDGTINGASAVNGTVTNRPSGYVIRTTTVNGKERYYLSV